MARAQTEHRTMGLFAATGVGVGAIVGGGVFVLAGVAYASAGVAALVAFALNGAVAFLTAMSFAEISSAFPQSGGAYNFAKKVLSVRAAFAVGWILWFAYIVAGVLYALGFASFAALAAQNLWAAVIGTPPEWLAGRRMGLFFASGATAVYAISLIRQASGGGQGATIGKVVVFAVIIFAGLVALVRQPLSVTAAAVTPFAPGGVGGVLMAMGFTFIALQGFDLIAAVAGEVKDPGRTIPRAMFLSLGLAMLIYLPLLFVVAAVGVEPGTSIAEAATQQPETVIADATRRFMGPVGYWLVIVAAILSTLSALHANLLAASRVALSMAQDRTLPAVLGDQHPVRRTPVMAIYASSLTLIAIVFMIPDLAAAGAAASLIFLISFAFAHMTTYLARVRGGTDDSAYQTRWFPAIPVAGGLACAALAVFQAVVVPDAGGIVVIWMGLGGILYWSLFARSAETADAATAAMDPTLVSLRGRSPLVLVSVANPASAPAMAEVANALAARRVGRVLLLTVLPAPDERDQGTVPKLLVDAQEVVRQALALSYEVGNSADALITSSADPLTAIQRVAEAHRCESLLLGLGGEDRDNSGLEALLGSVDCDIALMRAPPGWRLSAARRVLVAVDGGGEQGELRARVLGSICRTSRREVTFASVLPRDTSDAEVAETRANIADTAALKLREFEIQVLRADDPVAAILAEAESHDLIVLGLRRRGWRRKVLSGVALQIARRAPCAAIVLSRRPPRVYEILDPLRDVVVDELRGAVARRR
jgi:basic amino acid/polyamine antiporter, APA family